MAASFDLSEHFEPLEYRRTLSEQFPPPDLDAPEESWEEWVNILLIEGSSNWNQAIELMKDIGAEFLSKGYRYYEIPLKISQMCEKFIMAEGKF